ncbi:Contactin-3 [Galemys pyrenaicus]|uniref:Contactin-3 n=1 Tax=Galemys pyrenaicus TaxID=202257 RepID=A0A8J6A7Y9_GALPY|nr:Contactin-3 [Galemys pyrenaicus]
MPQTRESLDPADAATEPLWGVAAAAPSAQAPGPRAEPSLVCPGRPALGAPLGAVSVQVKRSASACGGVRRPEGSSSGPGAAASPRAQGCPVRAAGRQRRGAAERAAGHSPPGCSRVPSPLCRPVLPHPAGGGDSPAPARVQPAPETAAPPSPVPGAWAGSGWACVAADGPVWQRTGLRGSGRACVAADGPAWQRTGLCGSGRACVAADGPAWQRTGLGRQRTGLCGQRTGLRGSGRAWAGSGQACVGRGQACVGSGQARRVGRVRVLGGCYSRLQPGPACPRRAPGGDAEVSVAWAPGCPAKGGAPRVAGLPQGSVAEPEGTGRERAVRAAGPGLLPEWGPAGSESCVCSTQLQPPEALPRAAASVPALAPAAAAGTPPSCVVRGPELGLVRLLCVSSRLQRVWGATAERAGRGALPRRLRPGGGAVGEASGREAGHREQPPRGPVFTREPSDSVAPAGPEGRRLTLGCEARGHPAPRYRWQLNGTDVDVSGQPGYQLRGGDLVLLSPDRHRHAGSYQCFASNALGTVASREARVQFAYLDSFKASPRGTVLAREGQGVVLLCGPPPHSGGESREAPSNHGVPGGGGLQQQDRPSPGGPSSCSPECRRLTSPDIPAHIRALAYAWTFNTYPSFVEEDGRRFVSQETGHLYVAKVEPPDVGNYTCVVTSLVTGARALGPPTPLALRADGVMGEYEPKIEVQFPDVLPAAKGSSVKLECFALGNPVPQISWRRSDGRAFPSKTRRRKGGGVLEIPDFQQEDAGAYECVAENSRGRNVARGRLTYYAEPHWVRLIRDTELAVGDSLHWECRAGGRPRPWYRWLKNGAALAPEERVRIEDGVLTISRLGLADAGMFQCVAENKHGRTYTSAELRVLAAAPDFSTTPMQEAVRALVGSAVSLDCRPRASPRARFSWKRGDLSLQENRRVTFSEDGGLRIANVTKADTAAYTCVAENPFGRASGSTRLVVTEPTRMVLAPSSLDVAVGESVVLPCQVRHDPLLDVVFTWYVDGALVDFRGSAHWEKVGGSSSGDLMIRDVQLSHGGRYVCVARTGVDSVSSAADLIVRGPPGPPAHVQVGEVTATTARLSWGAGADNRSPLLSHSVQARTPFSVGWQAAATVPEVVGGDTRTATVVGLSPWVEYEFRVVASNKIGGGEPSAPSEKVRTEEAAPAVPPADVGGGGGGRSELVITWDVSVWARPGGHHGEPRAGRVSACAREQLPPLTALALALCGVELARGIPGLALSQRHQYLVTRDADDTEHLLPPSGPLDMPQGRSRDVSAGQEGHAAGRPVPEELRNGQGFGYVVAFRPLGAPTWIQAVVPAPDAPRYVFRNESILPVSPYEVRVGVYNRRGEGPFSPVRVVLSAEEAPPPVLRPLEAGRSSHAETCPGGRTGGGGLRKAPPRPPAAQVLTAQGSAWGQVASRGQDTGHQHPDEEGEPTAAPERVSASSLSSSEIQVSWAPAPWEPGNGRLLGYQVRYWADGEEDSSGQVQVAGDETAARLRGLRSQRAYHASVRAYNSAGPGPFSAAVNATTQKTPPSRPPGNVAWNTTDRKVLLRWERVTAAENESEVTGYKASGAWGSGLVVCASGAATVAASRGQVFYRTSSQSRAQVLSTNETRAELLLPLREDCLVEVKASTAGGDGASSGQVRIPRVSGPHARGCAPPTARVHPMARCQPALLLLLLLLADALWRDRSFVVY